VKVIHEFTDECPVQYRSTNCFGLIKNICTEHDYDLFIRNYFETNHAKGPQDATGGFLKNHVDLAVYRGSEIIISIRFFQLLRKSFKRY
jgi:hypothetical protein